MKRFAKLSVAALSLFGAARAGTAADKPPAAKEPRTIQIAVTENGFEPTPIALKKGEPVKLVITRKTDVTCAKTVVFDDPKVRKELPLNKPVEIAFTPTTTGDLKYGCSMGKMVGGVLHVE